MKKRWYAIGTVSLVAIISIVVMWLNVNRHYSGNNPLSQIPSSAALVLKINDIKNYKEIVEKTEYRQYFNELFFADLVTTTIDNALEVIDSIARNGLIDGRTIYISYHAIPTDTIGNTILSFPLDSYADGASILDAIGKMSEFKTEQLILDGQRVLHVDLSPNQFFITIANECLFATDNADLLRRVLNVQEPVLADDQCYSTLEHTTSKTTPISVFVNIASMDSLDIFDATTKSISEWGDWVELDFDVQPKMINGNGFLVAGKPTIYTAMSMHKPMPFVIDNSIPTSAIIFTSVATSKHGSADELYVEFLQNNGLLDAYKKKCRAVQQAVGLDVEAEMTKVFEAEMALFSFSESLFDAENACLIVNEKNGTIAQGILNEIICALQKVQTPREVDVISPVPSLSIPVYEAFPDTSELFFMPEIFGYVPHKYYLRYENNLLFADAISVLRKTLNERLQNRTYANDANFRAFRNNFSNENIKFLYCSSSAMRHITENIDTLITPQYLDAISDFYGFGLQVSNLSGLPYLTVCALYEPNKTYAQPTAWQCRIDTTIVGKPWPVINHNTQETEYLVQDAENRIHLINSSGLVLWSRKLDGRIQGDLTQIDYYCNGKLQYLFATKDAIHLIDRNGNDTAHFPIPLKSTATGGVTYIDYGNPSEFRLFVPCDNKRVMLYDKNCKEVEGWEMKPTEGTIRKPVDHWVTNGKDYLIHSDEYKCYITDRRGNERLPIKPLATNSDSRTYLVRGNTPNAAFVTSTADGKLATIDIATATITYTPIDSIGDEVHHTMLKFEQNDTLIFVDAQHLIITDGYGKVKNFRLLKLSSADDVKIVCNNMIAIWNKTDQLAYLFNSNGDLIEGFPIKAKGDFVVTKHDNILHIVVIDGNTLTNYLK